MHKLVELIDTELDRIGKEGLGHGNNLMELDKLVDIKKDIKCIEGMEKEEENMRYSDYDERKYGNRYGNEYGTYRDGESGRYSARGYDTKYRGNRYLGEMENQYRNYIGDREHYGADNTTIKSLEYMMKSVVEFIEMLKQDAQSQEEIEVIKEYSRKIANM